MKLTIQFILLLFFVNSISLSAQISTCMWIDSVSIVNDEILISWSDTCSNTPKRYQIHIFNETNRTWPVLDSVKKKPYQYIDNNDHNSKSYTYRLQVFYTNDEEPNSNDYSTIFLSTKYNSCDTSISLNWTPYINMPSSTLYKVFVKTENNDYILIVDNLSQTSYKFKDTSTNSNVDYSFFIRAFNTSDKATSSSNVQEVKSGLSIAPDLIKIGNIDMGNSSTTISFTTDQNANIKSYKAFGSPNPKSSFLFIDEIQADNTFFESIDLEKTNEHKYFTLSVINDCDIEFSLQDTASNLWLDGNMSSSSKVRLEWNDFTAFIGDVESYSIYRKEEYGDFSLINNVKDSTFTYTDYVNPNSGISGELTYYIEANEKPRSEFASEVPLQAAKSNTITIPLFVDVYFPNAFTPDALTNKVFEPSCSFVSETDYFFAIYNRWGTLVFSSNNPYNSEWDGTTKSGKKASEAVYIYTLRFRDEKDEIINRKGTVTLLR